MNDEERKDEKPRDLHARTKGLNYSATGVDIDSTDAAKRRMARSVDSGDPRVLNKLGAFASLVQGSFPGFADPVLVLKTDEPGSKQKLALELGRVEGLCQDLVNHLLNDVAVMGAHPLYVLDCIVCGRLESDVVDRLVAGMVEACRVQECVLVGGETSVQPGVVPPGLYVLSATAVGVAERAAVVDGARIQPGDAVLAVASNGLHTNGYSLVRALLEAKPDVVTLRVDGDTFLDVVMRPHTCYYLAMRGLFGQPWLHGLAHITGGGLRDNVVRILPPSVGVRIDLSLLRVPTVFRVIRDEGNVAPNDMLRTFNLGCGLIVVCDSRAVDATIEHFATQGHTCWRVGEVTEGGGEVMFWGEIAW
jgi:phosphoribosylformylglycinamidine cyclo-ligase